MTLVQRRASVGNYVYDVESTLILRCESHQPSRIHEHCIDVVERRLVANVEPTFAKRRQNNVDITLSTFQPIFNEISILYNDVVCPLGS